MKRQKTLIIGEAGVNHNGDIDIAKKLIDVAAETKLDIVKFQTFSPSQLATQNAKMADYQKSGATQSQSQLSMLEKLQLSFQDHKSIIKHCENKNITFLSSAFDIESLDFLSSLNLKYVKIPSGEITNLTYLRHVSSLKKPVILSTGMSSLKEIETAIKILCDNGINKKNITVLHCNSEYPTPMADVNLRAMENIKKTFDVAIGYSDHTLGIEVPIAAVALGATVIEKHFTLNRNMSGPDHAASLEPNELKSMVSAIRNIELAMGDGLKRASESEKKNITSVRKSIVAKTAITAGEIFSNNNLTIKRPGTGLSPMLWDEVMGQAAKQDFAQDELICL